MGGLRRVGWWRSCTIWPSTGCRGESCWRTSTSPGRSTAPASRWRCRHRGRRLPGGRRCWPSTRIARGRGAGRGLAADRGDACRVAGGATGAWTPMPAPGTCRWSWISRPPGCCSVRCRRRSMPGCNDILLIAFGLALAEFLGAGGAPIVHRCRGSRARRGAGRRCRLVAHGGLVHHQVPGGAGSGRTELGAGGRRRREAGRGDQGRQRAASQPSPTV